MSGSVVFTHTSGDRLVRPLFYDGTVEQSPDPTVGAGGASGTTDAPGPAARWLTRFASPHASGTWTWQIRSGDSDDPDDAVDRGTRAVEFLPSSGTLVAAPARGGAHPALTHGLPRLAGSNRALCYADGSPLFLVIDTAWAMPFRATVEDVADYAADRSTKGFNAVLLMTVQPDMRATGPTGRNIDEGFEVGFLDLPDGHLNQINIDYFRYLDRIIAVLLEHGITPVLQPVFHGFGWKGLDVAGPVVPPDEYARYTRYLVARYGASPVIYLPGGDGSGEEPQVEAAGREIQAWDAYGQPTGIHYRPHHRNDVHQAADWLDFQSCQTGHMGDHVPDRVATMWAQQPPKAVMNGEPSYEHSGRRGVAEGWWQGHEAWSNVCAGALMGVAYGAASMWQWRLHPDEPGHEPYFLAAGAGWREALDFEGSRYVGLVGKILAGLPLTNAIPCWDVSTNSRGLLDPGVLYLGYSEHGGPWSFLDGEGRVPSRYWMIDPRTGQVVKSGDTPPDRIPIDNDSWEPSILICAETAPAITADQPGRG
jgi:hypothetical protein